MSSRRAISVALALASLAAASAPAEAHGGDASASFDPLSLEWHAFLTADGRIGSAAPAPGAVAFPAAPLPPSGATAPLRFGTRAPVAFEPGRGFEVTLTLRVDKALVAEGDALELAVEPGGEALRVPFEGGPVLSPGTVVTVRARLQSPGAFHERGDGLTLVLTPLLPVLPEDALAVVVGGDAGSRFDALGMRVPSPADLRLQDVPHTEIVLGVDQFVPPSTHALNAFRVRHGAVEPPAAGAWSDEGTYVVLRGEEEGEEARSHAHAEEAPRREAAHAFRVNGLLARVHPGLGVIVRVGSLPIRVTCEANCPEGGFSWSHAPAGVGTSSDAPGVLVPPPRDTTGIPVSEDEPAPRKTPLAPPWALATLATLALLRARPKR